MTNAYKFDYDILTSNDSGIAKAPRRLLVVHTFEGRDLDAKAMARYQQQPSAGGSYHGVIDVAGKCARENDDAYIPWSAMRTGNLIGYHFSLAGRAAFTRKQWLARPKQLERLAQILAAYSKAKGIPLILRSAEEVRAGKWGVCGHVHISHAFRESDHTDPGPGFPFDVVIARAKEIVAGGKHSKPSAPPAKPDPVPAPTPPAPSAPGAAGDVEREVAMVLDQLAGLRDKDGRQRFRGWPQLGGRTLVDAVAAIGAAQGLPGFKDPREG